MVREGRVLIPTAGKPAFGMGFFVMACKVGAQVSQASSGTTIAVREGHGFAVDDKFIVGTDITKYRRVTAVSAASLSVDSSVPVASGELLINLGQDNGSTEPFFDNPGTLIYTDMDYSNLAVNSTVECDAEGRYRFWHTGIDIWDLALAGGTPFAIYLGTGLESGVTLNVLNFGAAGDGVTDDTSAIQSALSAVPATGAKVLLPAGTYMVNTALWIKSYTHLCGDGVDVSIIKRIGDTLSVVVNPDYNYNKVLTTGPSVGTEYTNASPGASITITDLTVDGNSQNQSLTSIANGAFGIGVGHTIGSEDGGCIDGYAVQRVKVQNTMQDGISIENCVNVLIDSCVTKTTGQTSAVTSKNGISLGGGPVELARGWCRRAIVTNNRVSYSGNPTGTLASDGIVNGCWDDVVISGNDISHVEYGIECTYTTSGAYTNRNWVIANNTIHDLNDAGANGVGITIARGTSNPVENVSVVGNSLYSINTNGMYFQRAIGLSVSGNSLHSTNLDADSALFCGIDFVSCAKVACTGNAVFLTGAQVGTYGIRFFGILSSLISGNVVSNDNASASAANILLTKDSKSNLVSNNRLIGNAYGILLPNDLTNSGNAFIGNMFSGALTANLLDSSGQTNYNYGGTEAGHLTVPGTFTQSSATADTMRIAASQIYMGGGTDTDQLFTFHPATVGDSGSYFGFKGSDAASASFEFSRNIRMKSPSNAFWKIGRSEEVVTIAAANNDSTSSLLPANSIIEAVTARILTTISGTGVTTWHLADPTTANRFTANNNTLIATTMDVGLLHKNPDGATPAAGPVQASPAKVRVAVGGSGAWAGSVRVTVFFSTFTGPAS